MITIPIDPTNPGHVFAAVGLTELAYRITGEATGLFKHTTYQIDLGDNLKIGELVTRIKELKLTPEDTEDKETPLLLGNLRLDWWLRPAAKDSALGNLKTWAGQTKIADMAIAARNYLNESECLLSDRALAYLPESSKPSSLTSLDAQRGRSTLDTGYSPNELKHKILPAPSVEFLALVGLQRAWPTQVDGRHAYYTWSSPLPPSLIPVALVGQLEPQIGYSFKISKDGEYSRIQPSQAIIQH